LICRTVTPQGSRRNPITNKRAQAAMLVRFYSLVAAISLRKLTSGKHAHTYFNVLYTLRLLPQWQQTSRCRRSDHVQA